MYFHTHGQPARGHMPPGRFVCRAPMPVRDGGRSGSLGLTSAQAVCILVKTASEARMDEQRNQSTIRATSAATVLALYAV